MTTTTAAAPSPDDDEAWRELVEGTSEEEGFGRTLEQGTKLLEDGYGETIAALADRIADACDARERRRMSQLVELAFRFEDSATLRPSAFVRYVPCTWPCGATARRRRRTRAGCDRKVRKCESARVRKCLH